MLVAGIVASQVKREPPDLASSRQWPALTGKTWQTGLYTDYTKTHYTVQNVIIDKILSSLKLTIYPYAQCIAMLEDFPVL